MLLSEATNRYHKLLAAEAYSDLTWAEELQERMRQRGLTDSGRLISPVLRPQFISRRQLDSLTRTVEELAEILDQVEGLALASPGLLARLQMLPAEKALATIPPGYSGFSVTSRMDAHLQNGSLCLRGLDTCKPRGLTYSEPLSDLFLDLPIVKDFKRSRYKLTKIGGGGKRLQAAVLEAWKEFGGRHAPRIAIVEFGENSVSGSPESQLLAELFSKNGSPARVIAPDQLEYSGGHLRAGDFEIDVVFRRLMTRELLAHFDLSHPLFEAYRARAVCVVNNFRSEFAQRRALFDLLTDETVTARLPLAARKLIRTFVPWTRVVGTKKTIYKDREVDLPEFILNEREQLVLRPNEDNDGHRVFIGAEMKQAAWENALRVALRTPYVVQERFCSGRELFPVYQYGELQMKEAEVSVQPHVFNGKMHGATAALETASSGCALPLAIAPVLLLEPC